MNLDELLANIRWLLNLPLLATPEEIAAELQKAADVIKNGNPEAAAAGFSLPALLEARNTEIVALRAARQIPPSMCRSMRCRPCKPSWRRCGQT